MVFFIIAGMAKFVKWLRKNAQSGHQWRKNGILL
jgi:hypothetical protein